MTEEEKKQLAEVIAFNKKLEEKKLAALAQEETKAEGKRYETPGMREILRKTGAECAVLLENKEETLPLQKEDRVAVFGRCQIDTFYVGYGSGGDVNPVHKVSILQGMEEDRDLSLDPEIASIYKTWCSQEENIPDHGFWGHWPYFYEEMELEDAVIRDAAKRNNKAVYVLGRAAGEDRENKLEAGSYYLTDKEKQIIEQLNQHFKNVIILLNIGNIIDLSWISEYENIKAVLVVWQLGQEMGYSVADVISGKVNPSGHLTDTIAKDYTDYPSHENFGDPQRNEYKEGIFVGYRYFESKAPEKVLYPFGHGLSYTSFSTKPMSVHHFPGITEIRASVVNTGALPGKDVVMIYISADLPDSKLERPKYALVGYAKTKLLHPGEEEQENFMVSDYQISSYDAYGFTGYNSSYVLEAGTYTFYVGDDVRHLTKIGSFTQEETVVTKQCEKATTESSFELKARIWSRLPRKLVSKKANQDKKILLSEVKSGEYSLDDFIAQLSAYDLSDLSRGEGPMNSDFGTPGNTGIMGGVTESLRSYGIPPMVTSDGPSGLRLMRFATLLPIGTALASSWDDELVHDLFCKEAEEIDHYKIDVLLAPGLNIHRNPLCGRNFEYYSEDPYLTGWMAAATIQGIQSRGASACPKHFACNSQETGRNFEDSVVDERTLREIYLKAFEMCVQIAEPKNLMTSYNRVNGVYSHYQYDLVETILRREWGYKGNVMTDWWMQPGESPEFPGLKNNAYRIRAGVNVLMPGSPDSAHTDPAHDYEIEACMEDHLPEGLTLGEMQENARHILEFCLDRM